MRVFGRLVAVGLILPLLLSVGLVTACGRGDVSGAATTPPSASNGMDATVTPPPTSDGSESSGSVSHRAELSPEVRARADELVRQGLSEDQAVAQALDEYWTTERMQDATGL